MRAIILLVACSLSFLQPTFAQQTGNMGARRAAPVAKTTAVASRLIASVYRYSDGTQYVPFDSVSYYFSGDHGGDLEGALLYDSALVRYYDASAAAYNDATLVINTYDAYNDELTQEEKTWDAGSGTFYNVSLTTNTYDTAHHLLSNLYQTWDGSEWANDWYDTTTYNTAGSMLTYIYQMWDGAEWVNSSLDQYTYDSSNNNITLLVHTWNTTTSAWDNAALDSNSYNSDNTVKTIISMQWNTAAASWTNIARTDYAYNAPAASGDTVTFSGWDTTALAWIYRSRDVVTFNAAGQRLTDLNQVRDTAAAVWQNATYTIDSAYLGYLPGYIIKQVWDSASASFVNATRDSFAVNSYGQETYRFGTSWDTATGTWKQATGNPAERYYYETYTTSVQNVSNTNCTAYVYPVPANDMLHVAVTWNEAQAFSIQIMDMSGHMVSQWQMPEQKTYNGNISVNRLPEGNYLMKITGATGQSVQRIVVAK